VLLDLIKHLDTVQQGFNSVFSYQYQQGGQIYTHSLHTKDLQAIVINYLSLGIMTVHQYQQSSFFHNNNITNVELQLLCHQQGKGQQRKQKDQNRKHHHFLKSSV